jgi:hypothetical protein
MAAVSWLTSALSGCAADAYRLQPARAPELVERYEKRHEAVIWYRGKRYPIREEHEPKLRVQARLGPQHQHPGARATPTEPALRELSAPLRDVRAEGDALTFPNGQRLRSSELTSTELLIDGEPLASVKGWEGTKGERPFSTRRAAMGFQIGGTSYLQLLYRLRVFGPLLLDMGAAGIALPGGAVGNVSGGLVLDVPLGRRWSIYAGGGGGAAFVFAGDGEGTGTTSEAYVYGRLGFAVRLGADHLDQIGIDGGAWYGNHQITEDGADGRHSETSRFLRPMAGFFFLHAL